jgi:hypothetical protein
MAKDVQIGDVFKENAHTVIEDLGPPGALNIIQILETRESYDQRMRSLLESTDED